MSDVVTVQQPQCLELENSDYIIAVVVTRSFAAYQNATYYEVFNDKLSQLEELDKIGIYCSHVRLTLNVTICDVIDKLLQHCSVILSPDTIHVYGSCM